MKSVEENAYSVSHNHIINSKQPKLYLWSSNSPTPEFNMKIFTRKNIMHGNHKPWDLIIN